MAKNKSRRVRLSMIGVSALFFFNPNIMLFDILPDFIGWALLLFAFSPAADTVPHFAEACGSFKKMLFITLARIPCLFIMLSVFFKHQTERAIVPLFVLCFGALELAFGIAAFKNLFEGIGYAASRSQENSAFYLSASNKKIKKLSAKASKLKIKAQKAQEQGKTRSEKRYLRKAAHLERKAKRRIPLSRLLATAYVMLTVKAVAEFLPELTYLSSFDSLGYITPTSLNVMTYRKYFVVIAAIISLISGTFFLKRFVSYSKAISASDELNAYFSSEVKSFEKSMPHISVHRRIHFAAMMLLTGFVLMIDFYSNSLNIIPDFVGYSVLFCGAVSLLSLAGSKVGILVSGILCTAISAWSWFDTVAFTSKYDYAAVSLRENAANAFINSFILNVAEQLCAAVFIAFILSQLYSLAKKYASYKGDGINEYTASNTPLSSVFKRKFVFSYILFAISAISSVLLLASRVDAVKTVNRLNDVLYIPRISWGWMLQLALTAIWIIYVCRTVSSLDTECARADKN